MVSNALGCMPFRSAIPTIQHGNTWKGSENHFADSHICAVKQQLSSSDYTTKTAGARHTPAAAPIGEGVYAITKTGRETHLAYILTIPSEISEVQDAVGLRQRGSYLTSAKNPTTAAPANASLPHGADYPQE